MASSPSHDQRRKAPQEILSQEIEDALGELRRPTPGLLISALSAGLDIGFGPLLMVATMTLIGEAVPGLTSALLLSVMYSVGFLFVVLGRSELFTEHTTMALLPVLDRRASLVSLGRLWVLIYVGNLVGCMLFSAFATFVATRLDLADSAAFAELAIIFVNQDLVTTLFAGVLAGWLMGLLTWLVTAARDTVGEILIVFIIASVIGFTHLPHAIAGSVEVLMGVFGSEEVTLVAYGRFLLGSTVGNAIGGVVFVSLIKYGHAVRQSAGSPADVDPEELT